MLKCGRLADIIITIFPDVAKPESLSHQTSGMWKCQERRRLRFSFVWTFCSDRQILTEHQLGGRPLPHASVLDLGVCGDFTHGREALGQVRQEGRAAVKVRGSGGPLPPSRKEASFSAMWLYLGTVALSDSPSPATSRKARPREISG